MSTKMDHTGQVYGRLTILQDDPSQGCKRKVLCRCECGRTKPINLGNIINKKAQSCGCLRKQHRENFNCYGGIIRPRKIA